MGVWSLATFQKAFWKYTLSVKKYWNCQYRWSTSRIYETVKKIMVIQAPYISINVITVLSLFFILEKVPSALT
jgi:hypothetical protein